jgi:LuxR family transcriptional regulator, maltose regulon positive regulatory protein
MAHGSTSSENPPMIDSADVPSQRGEDRRGAPRLPRVYIPRPRLWEQLDRATRSPLTLLVAPGGAGKTLGVGGWVRLRASAETENPIWVQGTEAFSPADLTRLITQCAAPPDSAQPPRLAILDEAQILSSATLRCLDERLSYDPESMRLLLLSRWDLPLTRLVPELLGNFTILRGENLRMTDAESSALVIEHARTTDREVIRLVTERAQGWCASVVLAARTVAASADPRATARALVAQSAPVDRVVSEVFSTLGGRERHLLLCVAGEGFVGVTAACHLSHDPGAGEVLADLETTGLLVARVPVQEIAAHPDVEASQDEVRYRIHPLLAEVIRRRLTAGGVDVMCARATVVRAVELDVAQGRTTDALRRLFTVGAVEEAADLIAHHGVRLVLTDPGQHRIAEFARSHPDVVAERPEMWFPLALDRWLANDTASARHWADRLLEVHPDDDARRPGGPDPTRLATVRLWRALLGLESLCAAIAHAKRVLVDAQAEASADVIDSAMPVLLNQLGVAQNWAGDLAEAETNLTLAIGQSRNRGLEAFAVTALTHLALTEYMAGREHACMGLASEALATLEAERHDGVDGASARADLALTLGQVIDVPHQIDDVVTSDHGAPVDHADLTSRFWTRMRDARLELISGSAARAERVLTEPSEYAELVDLRLPAHLRVAILIERAVVASLASDRESLKEIESHLTEISAAGEAAFVRGLRADLDGDRRRAAASFERAAADAVYSQPPTRAVALVCEAQLLDALGEPADAEERLRLAIAETRVRRNATPFVGWTRQGTPMRVLMERIDDADESGWTHELVTMTREQSDVAGAFRSSTATPRERDAAADVMVLPVLSPREREVLFELARGSTYADIAGTLFVSENTVKTHVSSLYGKLAVSRRSEALAISRTLGLL